MRTTILGGVLFLIPLVFVSIILGKAFQISMLVAGPLDKIIPVNTVAGVAFVNIIAIVVILAVCFAAGLAARKSFFSHRMSKLDGILIDIMPGYAVAKGMIGSMSRDETLAATLTPVLVRFDDYSQIAFELERDAQKATLFLPGSPSAWSGSAILVDLDRIEPLDMPTHKAVKLLRVLGRGSINLHPTAKETAPMV